ncbi:MAG: NADP-dependent isocitrate dehydrogenase [Pseudomonadota bacterium]
MSKKIPITIAHGDGIGPEIMAATLKILEAAKANIDPHPIEIGEQVYLSGNTSGIPDDAWTSLQQTKLLLKAPITTPQGGGYKSLNVTIRKTLGLFANVRPCRALSPFIPTHFPDMNVIVVRENEEDLYAGIEYRQSNDVYQALKLISHHGSEKIIRFAFDYARKFNRKKITCMVKDNIMKMTDGIFHKLFQQIAKQYPDIECNSLLMDIGTARLAANPEDFDVIVTENLYGDILSDVTAQIAGSVGLAGSANFGDDIAMFEAIHGSAPDIAGKKIANPSGLLNAALMMLVYIGENDKAELIENAWLTCLEEGIHTVDIYQSGHSKQKVNTDEFADAIIERLGKKPAHFAVADYQQHSTTTAETPQSEQEDKRVLAEKVLVGTDVYIDLSLCGPQEIADRLLKITGNLHLQTITNRGVKVWPHTRAETYCSDHWCCRFFAANNNAVQQNDIIDLLRQVNAQKLDIIKSENLYTFDGERGYTLAQGE